MAEHMLEIGLAIKEKRLIKVWHEEMKEMIEVSPSRLLLNDLDAELGKKNAAMHWNKNAGGRELTRRGNRGQIVHDAVADWCVLDRRVDPDEMDAYVGGLIEERGYALNVDYCLPYVRSALEWLDKYVLEVWMGEGPVFNFEYGWAGTVDLIARLREGTPVLSIGEATQRWDPETWQKEKACPDDLWQLDFKSSKSPKPDHLEQAATYWHSEFTWVRGMRNLIEFPKAPRVANILVQENSANVYEWTESARYGVGSKKAMESIEFGYDVFLSTLQTMYLRMWHSEFKPALLPEFSLKRPRAGRVAGLQQGIRNAN